MAMKALQKVALPIQDLWSRSLPNTCTQQFQMAFFSAELKPWSRSTPLTPYTGVNDHTGRKTRHVAKLHECANRTVKATQEGLGRRVL